MHLWTFRIKDGSRKRPFFSLAAIILTLSLAVLGGSVPSVRGAPGSSHVISATTDKTVYESSFQNFGFYAQSLYWVFFENTAFTCEGMGGCLFYSTSSDGASWASPTSVQIHVTDSDWSIVSDSTHVYLVRYDENYFDSFCNRPLLFQTGTINSNGSISWQAQQTVRSPSPTEAYPNTIVRVDSNGQVWIGYQDDHHSGCGGSGLQTPNVIHSNGTNYSVWTGDSILTTSNSNNWDIGLAMLSGGKAYAAYWINGHDLHGRLYNGTTWGPDEQVSYSSDSTDVNSFIFGQGTSVYAIWYDTNSATLRFGSRAVSGQWSTSNIGTGEAQSAGSLGRYSLPITATFDPYTGQFHIFWFNTSAGVIDQWTGSGNSWTKTSDVFNTQSETGEYTISSYYQSASVNGSDSFGLMWVDQSSSSYNLSFGLVNNPAGNVPPTGKSLFDHVVVILMENHGLADICGLNQPPCSTTNGAPYMAGLANNYALANQYVSLSHHSYPNYIALLGGSTFGCNNDQCSPVTAPNLVDRMEQAGLTWRAYMENQNLASGCDTVAHQPYDPAHNPFTAFTDILNNNTRCSNIVLANPSGCTVTDCALVNDLNSASAPSFMWLTPNMCDDMHGSTACTNGCSSPGDSACTTYGDNYLSSLAPNILNSTTFRAGRSALVVLFDEGNSYCPMNNTSEDCTYAVWAGPVAKTGFSSSIFYDHYSFTRTIEQNWNLPALETNDASANPMTEFLANNPALPPPSVSTSFSFSPNSPGTGQSVNFNTTVTGGASPYSYNWSFGDNTTGSGASPTHSYSSSGPYDVLLTVADANGLVARTSRTLIVTGQQFSPPPLTTSFTFTPSAPVAGQPVTFTASVSGGTAPYSYAWSFGDGSSATTDPSSHTFSSPGTFNVTFAVTDANGSSTKSGRVVAVSAASQALVASFSFTPASPTSGQPVTFSASASGGNPPYSFSWSFGDGSNLTGSQVTHSYSSAGSFTVTLTVSDSSSPQTSIVLTKTINVTLAVSTKPTYTLTWMGYDWDGHNEETLTVNGQYLASLPVVSSPQNGGVYTSFSLNITGLVVQGANALTFTHASWDCGTLDSVKDFQVNNQTETVSSYMPTMPLGCNESVTYHFDPISGEVEAIAVGFTQNPTSPDAGQTVKFTSSAIGGDSPLTYTWSYGDSATGTGSSSTHVYTTPGTYTAILTIRDFDGNTASISKRITVYPPLSASFTYSPSNPLPLQQITFTGTATGGLASYAYTWNFGDGTTATGQSATHSYTLPGTYTVTLTVTDANSEAITTTETITIITGI